MRTMVALGMLCSFAVPCGAADPPAKTDRYGDPLPDGALMRLGTLRNRAPITGFGIEKDGTVVTAARNAEVRRWSPVDDKSDEPIQLPLPGRESGTNIPQVSPDARYVAAYSDEKLFVYSVPGDVKAKPKEVAVFEIANVQLFRFSPDGAKLVVTAVRSPASQAHVCDIQTGKMTELKFTPLYTVGVSFSGDGKRVGVVADHDFYLFDAVSGEQLATYRSDEPMSSAFALNLTGDVLAAPVGSADSKTEVRFIDPLTGKNLDTLKGPPGSAAWVTFAPDGKTLLLGDRSGVRWWDPAAGKLIRSFEGAGLEAYALQRVPARFSPDGKLLVAQTGSALLRWDPATGKPLFPEQNIGHGEPVYRARLSPDGKRIATHGTDQRVCVWDVATGKELWHAPAAWWSAPTIDFSPDGKFLFAGAPDEGAVVKFDAATGTVVTTYATDPKGPKQPRVYCARVSGDGKTVYAITGPVVESAARPGFVTAWDTATGERTTVTERPPYATHLSPGAEYVVTSNTRPFSAYVVGGANKNLLESNAFRGFSLYTHFSDDGKWLTQTRMENGGRAFSTVVFSTSSWDIICTVPMTKFGHAALAPDCRTLAVAVGEKIEFFDTATARSLSTLRAPAGDWERAIFGNVTGLCFTPDGTKLITGHADTTALVWSVPPRPAK